MSFQQGLSGLNVSSKALDAIGNNIANANTVGFKSSSVQFADVYAASLSGGGAAQIGIGAAAPSVAQLFTQGNITTTNNPLDLAINGGGFFRLSDGGSPVYSRSGQFNVDSNGYVVNPAGLRLTGYAADSTGAIVPGDFTDLRLVTTNIEPQATTTSQVQLNMDSRSVPPTAMLSGSLAGSTPPVMTIIDLATATATPALIQNDQLNITVDGVNATVTIPRPTGGAYSSSGSLATALQAAINANSALIAANALVDVTVNTAGNIQIDSRSSGTLGSQGSGSSVTVTSVAPVVPPDGAIDLLGATPVATAGSDNFSTTSTTSYTGSTAQTVYDTLGNPHNLTMYFAQTSQANTWQMYTTLDGTAAPTGGSATGSIAHTTFPSIIAATDTFDITVDGLTAALIAPAGGYVDSGAMILDLQTKINAGLTTAAAAAVPPIVAPNIPAVTVSVNGARIVVTSSSTGTSSNVAISNQIAPAAIFGTISTFAGGTPEPTLLTFSTSGQLTTAMPLSLSFDPNNGAVNPLAFTLDLTGTSQYGISFGVNNLLQDGYTSGKLSGMSVAPDGIIQGRYSNGQSRNMGQLVLANFNNPNGLTSMGGNVWAETSESGQPIPGTPGQGSLGAIQSAAVEESNTDLTAELVNMITQQRVYQANAQSIKTQDQILQTLVNLR
jgi:flagellar hook protein FlgE